MNNEIISPEGDHIPSNRKKIRSDVWMRLCNRKRFGLMSGCDCF